MGQRGRDRTRSFVRYRDRNPREYQTSKEEVAGDVRGDEAQQEEECVSYGGEY